MRDVLFPTKSLDFMYRHKLILYIKWIRLLKNRKCHSSSKVRWIFPQDEFDNELFN
jgi:hypothetical protein